MSHYCVEVHVSAADHGEAVDALADTMAPHEDRVFDWYQFGGRWRGHHDPHYSADKDETLKRKCHYCNGTGKRTDMVVANGCNGCSGTGMETLWPTEWPAHQVDAIEFKKLSPKLQAYGVIANGVFHELSEKDTVKSKLKALGIKDGFVLTVDCHN